MPSLAPHLLAVPPSGIPDEVLIPDPGYTTFTMTARMLQVEPVPYPLRADHGFIPQREELDRLVTERTRAIIVNSPSNPLGTVFDEPTLRELLDFAQRHDLWVISDEVYEYFTWAVPHLSIAAFDQDDRVFSVFSLSKTYAMTGARVGYLVTPPGMSSIMRTVQEATIRPARRAGGDHRAAAARGRLPRSLSLQPRRRHPDAG